MRRAGLLLACGLAACLALPAWPNHAPQQASRRDLAGWELTAFALTDQEGRPFTEERLRGRWTFVLLGDTGSCGRPCDAALQALAGLYQRLAPTQALQTTGVLFVSLDPGRDTPQRLRSYLAGYDRRFIGVTGPPATLRRLADDLGANGDPSPPAGSLLLVGPDGVVRVEYLPPFDVARLTAAYLRARLGRL
jgi:protein SCO1/2